jgi:hypothetical protein
MPKAVKVSWRTLTQRLNRRLKRDHQQLMSPRGRSDRGQLGDYFTVSHGRIAATHVTPETIETMARDLGVLRQWEEVR